MVKSQNANFSLPDRWAAGTRQQPDVPPGFEPHPLNTCTSAAAAAESSRNRDLSSRENDFGGLLGQTPNSSGRNPPRRTLRKRERPQFYADAPPPAPRPPDGPRRRGRPPKARPVSQISHQAIETRNGEHGFQNTTSPLPVIDQKQDMCTPTFQAHDGNGETLFDISLTEVPGPISGFKIVGNVDRHEDRITQGIDLKILQHAANALNNTQVKSKFSDIDKNLFDTLKVINEKYGDITRDCSLKSDCMKTLVLLGICKVVQDLQKKQLKDLDMGTFESYLTTVKDAENMKVNVQWLHNRLNEIKDVVRLNDEEKGLVDQRNICLENIEKGKKEISLRRGEMERLKTEIRDFEDKMAHEAVLVEQLNGKISAQTSKFSQFQHMYVLDGLV